MRAPRFLHLFTVVALVAGSAVGCTPKSEKVTSGDELARANYLIEENQTSEAIYILGERIKRDAQDQKARVLLASAYASRAGLQLSRYRYFADELAKWEKPDDLWPEDSGHDALAEISKASYRIHLIIRAFDAIPQPANAAAREDLITAVRVFEEGGPVHGGPSLYLALLRTALFKDSLTTSNKLKNVQACQVEVQELLHWLITVERDLEQILRDVAAGVSDPDARQRLEDLAQSLRDGTDQALAAIVPDDSLDIETWMQVPGALKKVLGLCK